MTPFHDDLPLGRRISDTAFSRRTLLGAGLAAGLLPLLAACAPSGSGGGGAKTPTSFWSRDSMGDGAMQVPVRDRVAAFDAANDTTTSLQFLNLADSSQKELAGLTGGGLPTLAEQGADVTMQFASGKHLLPLDEVYSQIQGQLLNLPKAARTEIDGVVYGLPWWLETRVLYFHKDLLDDAGVDAPTTWDEWLAAAAATTKGSDQYGFVTPGQGASPGQLLAALAASAGATLVDSSGTLDTDTAPFGETLDFLQKLYKQGMPEATPTYDTTTAQQLFLAKKAAMTWDNGAILQSMTKTNPDLLDTVSAVATPRFDSDATSRSFLGGFQLFAFAEGQSPEKAPDFLSFFYSDPDWYAEFIAAGGGTSLPVTTAAAGPDFADGILKTLVEQVPTAVRYAGPDFGTTPYMGQAETTSVFADPVVSVWSGSASPQDAASTMMSALETLASA